MVNDVYAQDVNNEHENYEEKQNINSGFVNISDTIVGQSVQDSKLMANYVINEHIDKRNEKVVDEIHITVVYKINFNNDDVNDELLFVKQIVVVVELLKLKHCSTEIVLNYKD